MAWGGEEVDLKVDQGAGLQTGLPGGAGGTRHWIAGPLASLLATGSVY